MIPVTAAAPASLSRPAPRIGRNTVLWLVLFLICFGLGYPVLNRFDARQTGGLSNTSAYYDLVTQGPAAVSTHVRYRVLIPFLARPFYRLAEGRLGTWEPVFFGLLIVNAILTASTAWLLIRIGAGLLETEAAALLAGAAYLLNFETANIRLAGMVDSAEGFFLLALAGSLLSRRLWLLPLCGALGALAKESFAPFSLAFTAIWWISSRREARWRPHETVLILSTGAIALAVLAAVHSAVAGRLAMPWQFGNSMRASSGHLTAITANLIDRNLLYGFVWLAPLGVWRLNRFPRPWLLACAAAGFVGIALVGYYGASPGTAARFLFSIAGPLLSLSVAALVAPDTHVERQPGTTGTSHAFFLKARE